MTDGLSSLQARILTIALNTAVLILIGTTSYLYVKQADMAVKQAEMAEKFVLISQYRVDTRRSEAVACRLEAKFEAFANRVDTKIDKLIMRQGVPPVP